METKRPGTNWDDVRRTLNELFDDGEVWEIRIVEAKFKGEWDKAKPKTIVGYFDDVDRCVGELTRVGEYKAAYFTMNPVSRDGLSRLNNRLDYARLSSEDKHVVRRRRLVVDLDPVRMSGTSATDEEVEAAGKRGEKVKEKLDALGFGEPMQCHSGNGRHLVYQIDLPNDEESKSLVESCLKVLHAEFSDDRVDVDETLFNAARIMKLWGTPARKGDSTKDRPHRTSGILHMPDGFAGSVVPREALQRLAAESGDGSPAKNAHGFEACKPDTPGRRTRDTGQRASEENWDLRRWLAEHGVEALGEKDGKIFVECPWLAEHSSANRTESAILTLPSGAIAYKCQHAHCAGRGWAEFREHYEPGYKARRESWTEGRRLASGGDAPAPGRPSVPAPVNGAAVHVPLPSAAGRLGEAVGAGEETFLRGGEVVSVQDGVVRAVSPAEMCSRLEAAAELVTSKRTKTGELEHVGYNATQDLASRVMSCPEFRSRLPRIEVLSACPVLADDGRGGTRLVTGYDRESGIYVSGGTARLMPLDEARGLVVDLVSEFSFETESDRSRAVAALLTPAMLHGGLLGEARAPIDLCQADESQAGKGYRNKLLCSVYGVRSGVITPRDKGVGGLGEAFSAKLLDGHGIIYIDNLRGKLDCQEIESATTEDTFHARAPHRDGTVDMRKVVLGITSNGMLTTPDILNRASLVRIRKRRGFQYRSLSHFRDRQGDYLGAVLSVVKAWSNAGRPETGEDRHDNHGWAKKLDWIVRELLGLPPLLDGMDEARASFQSSAVGLLRAVALAATEDGPCRLKAIEVARLAQEAGIECSWSRRNMDDDDDAMKAARSCGCSLAAAFRELGKDEAALGGVSVRRVVEWDEELRSDQRSYEFSRDLRQPRGKSAVSSAVTQTHATVSAVSCLDPTSESWGEMAAGHTEDALSGRELTALTAARPGVAAELTAALPQGLPQLFSDATSHGGAASPDPSRGVLDGTCPGGTDGMGRVSMRGSEGADPTLDEDGAALWPERPAEAECLAGEDAVWYLANFGEEDARIVEFGDPDPEPDPASQPTEACRRMYAARRAWYAREFGERIPATA